MGQLIESLLELSRSTSARLQLEPVDVTELASGIAADLASSHPSPEVDWSVEEGLAARADPTLLRVVFQNLLGNAWKFTGKRKDPKIHVGALAGEGERVLFVRDNGVGFDKAWARKLFQPFERLHPATEFPGAGIGLATVRRIVERHRGRIWAEAEPGAGATFFFTLASATAPVPESQERLDSHDSEIPAIPANACVTSGHAIAAAGPEGLSALPHQEHV
jgi:signal transduction histidine kinase